MAVPMGAAVSTPAAAMSDRYPVQWADGSRS